MIPLRIIVAVAAVVKSLRFKNSNNKKWIKGLNFAQNVGGSLGIMISSVGPVDIEEIDRDL